MPKKTKKMRRKMRRRMRRPRQDAILGSHSLFYARMRNERRRRKR
jgi:hypothetical protein